MRKREVYVVDPLQFQACTRHGKRQYVAASRSVVGQKMEMITGTIQGARIRRSAEADEGTAHISEAELRLLLHNLAERWKWFSLFEHRARPYSRETAINPDRIESIERWQLRIQEAGQGL